MSFCSSAVQAKIVKNGPIGKSTFVSKVSQHHTNGVVKTSETVEKPSLADHPLEKKYIDAKNLTIFHIDSAIKEYLSNQIKWLPHLESELKKLTDELSSHPEEQNYYKQKIVELRKKIKDIETTSSLSLYILNSAPLIDEYRALTSTETARSFVTSQPTKGTSVGDSKKEDIIIKYLLIARNYVELINYAQPVKRMSCPSCGNTDMRRSNDEDTAFKCVSCQTEVQIIDDTPSFKDTDRINMCSRYTYSRKGHFIDAIKKHQGKQNIDPDVVQSIVSVLSNEIKFHNLTPSTVKKSHIHMFLSEKGLRSHYEDTNLLYHIITGYPCPDISAYEPQLLEDFDEQESALDKVAMGDTRVNSLNVYYKLYKLLQHIFFVNRLVITFKNRDFYTLKTKAIEDEHDEKMRKAWNIIGWRWVET